MPRRKASGPGNGPAKGNGNGRPTMAGFTAEELAKGKRIRAEKRAARKAEAEAERAAIDEAKALATVRAGNANAIAEAAADPDMPTAEPRDFVRQQIRQWAAKKRERDPNFKPLARQMNAAEITNAFADLTEPALQALFDVLTDERAWPKDKILAAQEILNRRMGGIQQKIHHTTDDLAGKSAAELVEIVKVEAAKLGLTIDESGNVIG